MAKYFAEIFLVSLLTLMEDKSLVFASCSDHLAYHMYHTVPLVTNLIFPKNSSSNLHSISYVPHFQYDDLFQNMANAEEDLYRVWKDLTLNSSGDQSKY